MRWFTITLTMMATLLAGCGGSNPDAALERAVAQQEAGEIDAAMRVYTSILEETEHLGALINRGLGHLALEQYDDALADLDRAVELTPDDPDLRISRGVARFEAGRIEDAIADYTLAIEIDVYAVDAYLNRGIAYEMSGALDEALNDYTWAIRFDPDDVALYEARAAANQAAGEPDRAAIDDVLIEFTRAILDDPSAAPPRFGRARAFFELNEMALSVADLDVILEADPDDGAARISRGHALYVVGEDVRALADYAAAIATDPEHAHGAHVVSAMINEGIGAIDEAVAHLEQAVALDPADPDAAIRLAWLLATSPQREHRDGPRAVALASRAVTGDAGWFAMDTLAAAQATSGDFAAAEATLKELLANSPPAEVRDELVDRLYLYQSGRAHRMPS